MSSQGRWKHSREEIISQTLEKYTDLSVGKIVELESLLHEQEELTKGLAKDLISKKLGRLAAVPQTSEKYWLQRGWSSEEAVLKSRERKLSGVRSTKNIKSPFSREHWLEKINPLTGKIYTIEEADFKRNSLRPIRKEYWLAQNYNEEEAIKLAAAAKDKNNRNGGTKDSKYALRTVGYYQVRGHNLEEANQLLAEAQTTFSLQKLVEKYGAAKGKHFWQERQDKWQNTLNAKPFEEQEDINRRKMYRNGMSGVSLELFALIDTPLARWGKKTATNQGEMMVKLGDNKRAMIDFSLGNKLIEFYGDYWHANPCKYDPESKIFSGGVKYLTAQQKWEIDKIRHDALTAQGYQLLIIWEHDFKTGPEKVIEKCKNFLNS